MNKQEIQAKLYNYEERLKDVANEIERLREQLAKAEKPKLRHGDFGMWKGTNYGFVVDKSEKDEIYTHLLWKSNDLRNQKRQDDMSLREVAILGNIFDLLKEWSEDLERFDFDVHEYAIDPINSHAPIKVAGNWHTLSEAEEIWRKLGQLIATLKRKDTK